MNRCGMRGFLVFLEDYRHQVRLAMGRLEPALNICLHGDSMAGGMALCLALLAGLSVLRTRISNFCLQISKYNISLSCGHSHVSYTCVTLFILHFQLLHNHNISLSCGYSTAQNSCDDIICSI